MSYNLRSSNRLRNIQFKTAQQNEYIFRSSLSDCKRSRIDDFEQREFLSLFELVPCSNSNEVEIRSIDTPDYKEYQRKKRPLNPKNTKLGYSFEENNNVAYFDQSSRRLVLESELVKEKNRKSQLTKLKQRSLNSLYNAVAEKRKSLALKENAINENFLHKILAEDLVEKALFFRDKSKAEPKSHQLNSILFLK